MYLRKVSFLMKLIGNQEYKEWCLRKLRMGMRKAYYDIMNQRNNNYY